jgi:hypothetical protein
MFVSRKNLALIHFVTGEVPAGLYVSHAAHECIKRCPSTGAGGVLLEPFPECSIKRSAFRLGDHTGTLN